MLAKPDNVKTELCRPEGPGSKFSKSGGIDRRDPEPVFTVAEFELTVSRRNSSNDISCSGVSINLT